MNDKRRQALGCVALAFVLLAGVSSTRQPPRAKARRRDALGALRDALPVWFDPGKSSASSRRSGCSTRCTMPS